MNVRQHANTIKLARHGQMMVACYSIASAAKDFPMLIRVIFDF